MSLFVWCALKIRKAGHLNRFRAPTVVTRRRSINSTKVDWFPLKLPPARANSKHLPVRTQQLPNSAMSTDASICHAFWLCSHADCERPYHGIQISKRIWSNEWLCRGIVRRVLAIALYCKKTPSGESVRVILPESSEIWIPYWGPCRIRANYSFQVFDT